MSDRIYILVLLGLAAVASTGRADDTLPKAVPSSKYAKMAARSPFAPPTAPVVAAAAPTPPPAPGWADSLTATMVMRDGDKYMVTVVDAQNPQHLYLTSSPDPVTQMAVSTVKWGANREEAPTVTLSKGKEFAQVKYEAGTSSPGGINQMGGPPIPGNPGNPMIGRPQIPGAQNFRPPIPNAGQPLPNSAAIRRPIIRAPATVTPPVTSMRPLSQPNQGARPNPGVKVDDDDDDD